MAAELILRERWIPEGLEPLRVKWDTLHRVERIDALRGEGPAQHLHPAFWLAAPGQVPDSLALGTSWTDTLTFRREADGQLQALDMVRTSRVVGDTLVGARSLWIVEERAGTRPDVPAVRHVERRERDGRFLEGRRVHERHARLVLTARSWLDPGRELYAARWDTLGTREEPGSFERWSAPEGDTIRWTTRYESVRHMRALGPDEAEARPGERWTAQSAEFRQREEDRIRFRSEPPYADTVVARFLAPTDPGRYAADLELLLMTIGRPEAVRERLVELARSAHDTLALVRATRDIPLRPVLFADDPASPLLRLRVELASDFRLLLRHGIDPDDELEELFWSALSSTTRLSRSLPRLPSISVRLDELEELVTLRQAAEGDLDAWSRLESGRTLVARHALRVRAGSVAPWNGTPDLPASGAPARAWLDWAEASLGRRLSDRRQYRIAWEFATRWGNPEPGQRLVQTFRDTAEPAIRARLLVQLAEFLDPMLTAEDVLEVLESDDPGLERVGTDAAVRWVGQARSAADLYTPEARARRASVLESFFESPVPVRGQTHPFPPSAPETWDVTFVRSSLLDGVPYEPTGISWRAQEISFASPRSDPEPYVLVQMVQARGPFGTASFVVGVRHPGEYRPDPRRSERWTVLFRHEDGAGYRPLAVIGPDPSQAPALRARTEAAGDARRVDERAPELSRFLELVLEDRWEYGPAGAPSVHPRRTLERRWELSQIIPSTYREEQIDLTGPRLALRRRTHATQDGTRAYVVLPEGRRVGAAEPAVTRALPARVPALTSHLPRDPLLPENEDWTLPLLYRWSEDPGVEGLREDPPFMELGGLEVLHPLPPAPLPDGGTWTDTLRARWEGVEAGLDIEVVRTNRLVGDTVVLGTPALHIGETSRVQVRAHWTRADLEAGGPIRVDRVLEGEGVGVRVQAADDPIPLVRQDTLRLAGRLTEHPPGGAVSVPVRYEAIHRWARLPLTGGRVPAWQVSPHPRRSLPTWTTVAAARADSAVAAGALGTAVAYGGPFHPGTRSVFLAALEDREAALSLGVSRDGLALGAAHALLELTLVRFGGRLVSAPVEPERWVRAEPASEASLRELADALAVAGSPLARDLAPLAEMALDPRAGLLALRDRAGTGRPLPRHAASFVEGGRPLPTGGQFPAVRPPAAGSSREAWVELAEWIRTAASARGPPPDFALVEALHEGGVLDEILRRWNTDADASDRTFWGGLLLDMEEIAPTEHSFFEPDDAVTLLEADHPGLRELGERILHWGLGNRSRVWSLNRPGGPPHALPPPFVSDLRTWADPDDTPRYFPERIREALGPGGPDGPRVVLEVSVPPEALPELQSGAAGQRFLLTEMRMGQARTVEGLWYRVIRHERWGPFEQVMLSPRAAGPERPSARSVGFIYQETDEGWFALELDPAVPPPPFRSWPR